MLLKLLVYGPFGYIKNPYNIFDGVIVVIRYGCAFIASSLRNARGEDWGEEPLSLYLWGEGVWSQAPLTHRPSYPCTAGESLGPPCSTPPSLLALPCSRGTWPHISFGRSSL